MITVGKSDIGLIRETNQDAFQCGELPGGAWAVVCDGMGGANGGNVASGIAVEKISARVAGAFRENMADELIKDVLVAAIYDANTAVFEKAAQNAALTGMGTTVVAVLVNGGKAHIAHAGDSRAYLLRGGEIRQLTTDHSMVQEFVNSGDLTAQEAKSHPQKNIITRALGVRSTVEIDYRECELPPDARLLLCSDGLTNFVDDEVIARLSEECGPRALCEQLIGLAKQGGGHDNITVVVIGSEQKDGSEV